MQVEYTSPRENEPAEDETDTGRTSPPSPHHPDISRDSQVPRWKSWNTLAQDVDEEGVAESDALTVEATSAEDPDEAALPHRTAFVKHEVTRPTGVPYEHRPLLTPAGPIARTRRLAGDYMHIDSGARPDHEDVADDMPDPLLEPPSEGYSEESSGALPPRSKSRPVARDAELNSSGDAEFGSWVNAEFDSLADAEFDSLVDDEFGSLADDEFDLWDDESDPLAADESDTSAEDDLASAAGYGWDVASPNGPDSVNVDSVYDDGGHDESGRSVREVPPTFEQPRTPNAGDFTGARLAGDDPDRADDDSETLAIDGHDALAGESDPLSGNALESWSDDDLDAETDDRTDVLSGDGYDLTKAQPADVEAEVDSEEYRMSGKVSTPTVEPSDREFPAEESDTAPVEAEDDPATRYPEIFKQWQDSESEETWSGTDSIDDVAVSVPPGGIRHDLHGSEATSTGEKVDGSDTTHADEIGSGSDPVQPPADAAINDASDTVASDEYSILNMQDRVVIMLLFKQLVQIEDLEVAWRRWQEQGGDQSREPLWRFLTTDPSFDRELIFSEAAQVYAFPEATIDEASALLFLKRFKDSVEAPLFDRMQELRVIPVRRERKTNSKQRRILYVSHDPTRPEVNRLLRELKRESYEMHYAPEAVIDDLLAKAFPARNEYLERVSDNEMAYDLGTSYDEDESLIDEDALEAEIGRSTLINLFEATLVEAVRRDVSDIHIFPNPRKQVEIHFRVNGELECWHREERIHPEAFLAVVKDNTLNVDRFERDAAQDGFIQRKIDDTLIRFRVSVLPVANANQELRSESIVIRVLDDRKVITDLGKLGLLESARAKFEWAISQPHGMVILTGPTGSGKTTTLFAALCQVVTPKLNVLTVEDPVEYVIPGVRQVKLSHKLNLEQALRSILRHDPDVVMVGEMRDRQTADLAIKLANTGHLTFSTLHTNDAPSAISRLYKMGVEPFLIAYAINLVVAQRLVRVLCRSCKKPLEHFDEAMLERLGFTLEDLGRAQFFDEGHNPNCKECRGSGYNGRRAITETMPFSNEIRRQIVLAQNMIDEDSIRRQAESEGMLSLRASAREVAIQGETSVAELIRITAGEH